MHDRIEPQRQRPCVKTGGPTQQEKPDAVQSLAEQLGVLPSVEADPKRLRFRYRRLFKQLDRLEQRRLDIRLAEVAAGVRKNDEAKKHAEVLSAQ